MSTTVLPARLRQSKARNSSVTLDRADVALISIDDPSHIIPVPADQGVMGFRF
jgi:hypothetical protein